MSALRIGKVLSAIQFHKLYRCAIAERSLLRDSKNLSAPYTRFSRVYSRGIYCTSVKVSPRRSRHSIISGIIVFVICGTRHQHAVTARNSCGRRDCIRCDPFTRQAEIQCIFALDHKGFAFVRRRAFRQRIYVRHDSRVRDNRIFNTYDRSYRRTRIAPGGTSAALILRISATRNGTSQGIQLYITAGVIIRFGAGIGIVTKFLFRFL